MSKTTEVKNLTEVQWDNSVVYWYRYLLRQHEVKCCTGEAPYPSWYFPAASLCSQFSPFPSISSDYSSFHFLTSLFLLQLCFASANENNQQSPFMWLVFLISHCLVLQFPLFLLSVSVSSVSDKHLQKVRWAGKGWSGLRWSQGRKLSGCELTFMGRKELSSAFCQRSIFVKGTVLAAGAD